MYHAKVNGFDEFSLDVSDVKDGSVEINEEDRSVDITPLSDGSVSIIMGSKSYTASVISVDRKEKAVEVLVNSKSYKVQLKDRLDQLLEDLGMEDMLSSAVSELTAPMPGLVLDVVASEGQEVAKGDALIVLEAMKMENVLKSPIDGVVKSISAAKGTAVEKNQVLLEFEV